MENTKTNTRQQSNVVEIDLVEVFSVIWSNILLILLVSVLVGALTFFINHNIITPLYTSSTSIYISTYSQSNAAQDQQITVNDTQVATSIAGDYKELIMGRTVIEGVIEKLGIDETYEELSSKIEVTNADNTHIITISVTDPSPKRAQKLANTIREVASQHIENVMSIDAITVAEEANLPEQKSSPKTGRNTAIAFILAFLLMCVTVVVIYIADDRIKTSEDVEKYLGLSTLALIPMAEQLDSKK